VVFSHAFYYSFCKKPWRSLLWTRFMIMCRHLLIELAWFSLLIFCKFSVYTVLNLIQNSPAIKKVCGPKKAILKKDVKSKVAPRNGCDGSLMAKFLIPTIQVNLCCPLYISLGFGIKFTWIVVIKNFASSLPCSHFLAATLDFTSFFTMVFLGPHTFFIAGLFWIRFHFYL